MRVDVEKKGKKNKHAIHFPILDLASPFQVQNVKSFSAFCSSLGSIIKNQGLGFRFSGVWSGVPGVALLRFRVSALRCCGWWGVEVSGVGILRFRVLGC